MANILDTNANLLVALHLLVEERNVSRAAERFGVTQSSMSGSLARLRVLFDDPLLLRVGNRMELTPRAEIIAARVRQGFDAFAAALAQPAEFDPRTSDERFVIGANDYAGLLFIPRLKKRLAKEAPNVTLQVLPFGQLAVASELAQGKFDLTLGYSGQESIASGHFKRRLFSDRFVCIVRKGHPRVRSRLTLSTYVSLQHVIVTEQRHAAGVVDEALSELGRVRHVALRVPHFLLVPHIVAESDLIAAIDEKVAWQFAHLLPLQIFEPPLRLPKGNVNMVWHERTDQDPAQHWLRSTILSVAAEVDKACTSRATR